MKHNLRWFKFFTILALLTFTASLTPRVVEAQSGNPPSATPSPTVVVTVERNHIFEDKDWPIVRTETQQGKDPNTGEIYTINIIIRQAPQGAVPAPSNGCPVSDSVAPATGCTYLGATSATAQDAHLGGVVSNIKHYAYQYCYNYLCDVYRPYKVEEWWTRSNGNWTVTNANTTWGTDGSWLVCTTGSLYSYYYRDGPFTPSWNGNTTLTRIYTSSNWPQMQPTYGYPVTATITSDGYYSGNYVGSMWTYVNFNQ